MDMTHISAVQSGEFLAVEMYAKGSFGSTHQIERL
jgi:hypothetical protein